jgi:hypothetical protein
MGKSTDETSKQVLRDIIHCILENDYICHVFSIRLVKGENQ